MAHKHIYTFCEIRSQANNYKYANYVDFSKFNPTESAEQHSVLGMCVRVLVLACACVCVLI